MTNVARIPLRVVFYREEGMWVAHCLEFDVIGSGESKQEALDDLDVCIEMQVEFSVENKNTGNLFRPAPYECHQMFFRGRDVAEGELHLHFPQETDGVRLESMDAREYSHGCRDNGILVPA